MKPGNRVLITGVRGYSGRWLVDHLRTGPTLTLIGLGHGPRPKLPLDLYLRCDIGDAANVDEAVGQAKPDVVFHLAARTAASPPEEIERVNVTGFANLLRALRVSAAQRPVRLITIGSAAEFGVRGAALLPVDETAPCFPGSPYGRSKWAVTNEVLSMPADERLKVIVARTFNLIGPGLDQHLSLGSFAAQLAAVVAGASDEVRCGSLDNRRDFIDVRDAVAAYAALAHTGRPREIYHVCSGRSHRLGDLLDSLIALSGTRPRIVVEPSRIRTGDLADIYGSHDKLSQTTGWQPCVPIEQSLADMLVKALATQRRGARPD